MKQIVKNFNNQTKKTIFKVQNKTNNNFKISSFNKYLIAIVSSLFFYLFYLSIPIFYDKTWVQKNIEDKLLSEFRINLSTSADISYQILPSPHFLIKDSKILLHNSDKKKLIAEIKKLKVFIKQNNFFDKDNMNLKEVIAVNANFFLSRDVLDLLNNESNNKLSNKKIKINDSNIFLKNNLSETITIIKISKALLFFDDGNLLNLSGEVFKIPFTADYENQINLTRNKMFNIEAQKLRLNIFNKSNKTGQDSTSGKNIISFLNSKINTKYDIKEKLIIFKSNESRINNLQVDYNGELSINPFDLDLNIYLDNYKTSKLFNINPILIELIKSGLLFNNNISINTSIIAKSNAKDEIFQNTKVNFHIINGKIDFNKTRLISDDFGVLEFNNSNLFLKNNKLILNSDVLIDIKDSERLFSFLKTKKSSRINLRNIFINLDYDFSSNQIIFNKVKINNVEVSDRLLKIIEGFKNNNLNNFNRSRRLINKLSEAYEG